MVYILGIFVVCGEPYISIRHIQSTPGFSLFKVVESVLFCFVVISGKKNILPEVLILTLKKYLNFLALVCVLQEIIIIIIIFFNINITLN